MNIIFEPFIFKALIAGIIIAILAGIIGCFIVWKKMAYFGDSLAHSSLLGIAFGILLGINLNFATLISCLLFGIILAYMQQKRTLATDTLLGILAHSSLSIGIIAISLMNANFNLHNYLFGDILTVSMQEILWILSTSVIILTILYLNWPKLLLMTIDRDIAKVKGINTSILDIILIFMITLIVASSIKIFGILLISSMLIIPAATAKQIAKSPEKMALLAALFGIISVLIGIIISVIIDAPTGPTIVATSSLLFFAINKFAN